jgi:carbamate kinase
MTRTGKLAVIAVGGNSLIVDESQQTIPDQYEAVTEACKAIVAMIETGWNVVITHGNGPQVGFILRRSELALSEVIPVPMDYATADTQGAIGYMFQKALHNHLQRRGTPRPVTTVVTQVLVDRADPAFANPSKPIGAFMDEETARRRAEEQGWTVKEDAGRGWRRVVASPQPKSIVEIDIIHRLVADGAVVIACGGGGIPVYTTPDGDRQGVEAVVDKDYASGLLANEVGADLFLISTGVDRVAVNYNRPDQRWLDRLQYSEARRLYDEGHFAAGSMGPKVKAMLEFLARGGQTGIITSPQKLLAAIAGETGTRIVPDDAWYASGQEH